MIFPNDAQAPTTFDTTGQIPPPSTGQSKFSVSATLWEEEGTLLFHVTTGDGLKMIRREDNHMINGSKLLDAVPGMSHDKKNKILEDEKVKHAVLEAPSYDLLGTWIPFDRALDLANREGITELLYPIFVNNLGALLYNSYHNPPKDGKTSSTPIPRPKPQEVSFASEEKTKAKL